jgi:hypothetical protein
VCQAEAVVTETDGDRKLRGGSYKYFIRGQQSAPSEEDYKVEHVRAQRLKPYDVFLKKFQYQDALNAALESRHPVIVVSLLDELAQRGSLAAALSRRDDVALEPVLHFLIKHITNPHYARLLHDVSHLVLDIYGAVIGQSTVIDPLLFRLRAQLKDEVRLQKDMFQLLGALDLLLAAAHHRPRTAASSPSVDANGVDVAALRPLAMADAAGAEEEDDTDHAPPASEVDAEDEEDTEVSLAHAVTVSSVVDEDDEPAVTVKASAASVGKRKSAAGAATEKTGKKEKNARAK